MDKLFENKLEDETPVSWVGVSLLSFPSCKMAMLGDVFTAAEYRNQGRARKVILEAIECCKTKDIDFIFLDCRPELEEFYKKFGFEYANNIKMIYKIK